MTYDKEQCLSNHYTAPDTPLVYIPPIPFLATMEPLDTLLMGDEIISTTLERENDEFIKSSVDDLVPILRESEVTSVYDDLECSMPLDSPPSHRLDVLEERKVDIDLLLGEYLDTLLTRDMEFDFDLIMDIEELECLLVDDPVLVSRVFDEPLGNSNSEFKDISSLDPPESNLVIDESSLLVTPLLDSMKLSLREVERFDPFFSLTQSGEEMRVMKTSFLGFHHMPSPRPAAYATKVVMYCYFHPYLTSGDGFYHEPKMK
uniref:Reverse transcriptase domain-containing protein n=1 Tax=Tanacetum cinerariifolium TaxID=118510 RepID=A0A699IKM7_TANCI|nr:hypothetical protein [Tanacetum cinerariifolium]